MAKVGFALQVRERADAYKKRVQWVYRQSAEDVIEDAQRLQAEGGRMPFKTGFLRGSLRTTIPGVVSLKGADAYRAVAKSLRLGQKITAVWEAHYAKYIENGWRNYAPRHFAAGAAAKWKQIVAENTKKSRGMF